MNVSVAELTCLPWV